MGPIRGSPSENRSSQSSAFPGDVFCAYLLYDNTSIKNPMHNLQSTKILQSRNLPNMSPPTQTPNPHIPITSVWSLKRHDGLQMMFLLQNELKNYYINTLSWHPFWNNFFFFPMCWSTRQLNILETKIFKRLSMSIKRVQNISLQKSTEMMPLIHSSRYLFSVLHMWQKDVFSQRSTYLGFWWKGKWYFNRK